MIILGAEFSRFTDKQLILRHLQYMLYFALAHSWIHIDCNLVNEVD